MDSLIPVAIVAALILLNGLFVAAEFAIVGVSRAEIEREAQAGGRAARLVRGILSDPRQQDRFIATAQLGITAASLGLGMYGEHALAEWLTHRLEGAELGPLTRWVAAHSLASVLAIAILTYFHIVVGEMVPKSLALQRARKTALGVAPLMRAIQLATYPVVLGLNGIGNGLLRLFGIDRSRASAELYRTPAELAQIVEESEAGGLIEAQASAVVRELLEFRQLTAGEVMVPRVRAVGVPLGAGPDVIRSILRAAPHTRYPVYQGTLDDIVGVLHVRELLSRLGEQGAVSTAHVRPTPYVPATARVDQVLSAMRRARSQMAVVMDEHGGTAGLVTMEDLFEEVVGEITERADERPEIEPEREGRLRVDGAARLEDVGAELDLDLEHEEVDTVSGLVLTLLGRPPRIGDAVSHGGARVRVTAVRGRGVKTAVVEREPGPERAV